MEAVAEALSPGNLWWGATVILVLLGTNPYPFTRLLNAVDAWALKNNEKVIAQSGHSPAEKLSIECHPFVSHAQILKWVEQAEVVICQGGMGSLRDCLMMGKPTIAVPRLPELGESKDKQIELVEVLNEEGKVIALLNVDNLAHTIEAARHMAMQKSDGSKIPSIVAEKIHSVLGRA